MFFKRFRVNFKSQISTGFYHFPLVFFISIGEQMLVKFFLPSSSPPGFHLLDSLLSVINHDFSYSHIYCQRKATKAAAKITPIMAQIQNDSLCVAQSFTEIFLSPFTLVHCQRGVDILDNLV